MNPLVIAAVGGAALAVLLRKGSSPARQLVVGNNYVATFETPPGAQLSKDNLIHVRDILPEGSFLSPTDDGNLAVRFTAVSSRTMGDIPTPIGNFKLVALKEVPS